MAKFKNNKGESSQALNTASLPDIVFMLLFFFMVVTKIKDKEMLVSVAVPQASEVIQIKNKNVISYIYVGKPKKPELYGTATRIQLNDAFKDEKYIPTWVEEEKKKKSPEFVKLFTVNLKADKNVKMGIITDIKMKLRKSNALKLVYSTNKGISSKYILNFIQNL